MIRITSLVLVLALSTAGCSQQPAVDYFPLAENNNWSYQITQSDQRVEVVHESLPAEELFGRTVYPRTISMRDTKMEVDYFVSDESGVYLFATQERGQPEPVANPSPTFSYARPVKAGAQWEEIYEGLAFGDGTPVPLSNVIDGTEFTVLVPAGNFSDCLKYTGTGEINTAKGKLAVTVTQWYAPDIGLVKYMMSETTDNDSFRGLNLTVVLMESNLVDSEAKTNSETNSDQ
jgi:hypothetical protein